MSSSSAPKKAKTASDNDDFETVKRYLLECPLVTPENPAIKAALEGIEKEQNRRERDAKLQRKFAQATSTTTFSNGNLSDSVVVIDTTPTPTPPPTSASNEDEDDDADEMMEWQDVAARKEDDDDDDDEADGTSFLGKKLVKIAIDSISEHQVKVKSPVAAIAVVIHASLRSQLLGFSCTGIPEAETLTGFAPSVRALPPSQFLPPNWDTNPNKVSLRYRKHGTGALVLVVQEEQAEQRKMIHIHLQPASSKEPPTPVLSFSVEDHVNLDSWNAALKVSSILPPALHYKSLAVLLTNVCRAFDLGAVDEAAEEGVQGAYAAASTPYVDNTIPIETSCRPTIIKSDFVPNQPVHVPGVAARRKPWEDGVPTTLDQAFPGTGRQYVPNHGDFAGDLVPAGLMDPRFANRAPPGGRMGGNMMGPNHPMFQGGGVHGPPLGGPGSMQPRFDPFYPPGVDVDFDVNGKPRRNRPSRSGDPNPDHLPPPNAFGNDMFS
jgi:hypothetical protein